MTDGFLAIVGGIGVFLFGMKTMTDALRDAAGAGMRRILARFTTTPLRGVAAGTAVTALIQSSTATTVMTIGFVGAGLLSFPQSLGVLYGANIGTTNTGWMVTMLGLKLQLGQIALPVLLVASLMAALTHGQTERFGRGLAGLCLLFIGLDMMQAGAAVFDGVLTPDQLPGDTHWGRLQLVALGAAVVAVLQSSSAGVVMVLVLAGSGALSFGQGAALVIGMNIGTTTTGLLAGVGAGRAARQTGIANFMFNAVTAAIAFPLVGVVAPLLHGTALGRDDATALVLFHTGFNLLGAALFLPVTPLFARLVDRLVADRPQGLAAGLDRALLDTPDSALDAGHTACAAISDALFAAVGAALAPEPDLRGLSTLPDRIPPALTAVDSFLAGVRIPADRAETKARYAALLHQIDHLSRLDDRARNRDALAILPDDPGLRRAAHALGAALRHPDPVRLERLVRLLEMREHRHRRATLLREHVGLVSVAEVFRRTDAMRWLLHLAQHAERISHYRAIGAAAPAPARKN